MAYAQIARGMDDLQIVPYVAGVVGSTYVDGSGVQAAEWSTESDSEELRGDNTALALVRSAKTLSGTLRFAVVDLDAYAAMVGGTVVTSGTGATEVQTLEESAASPARYVQIIGQAPAIDAEGAAYRITIYKAMVTSGPNESLTIDEWNTPEFEFQAIANASGNLLKRQQYKTAIAIEP